MKKLFMETETAPSQPNGVSRRGFLQLAGVGALVATAAASCKKKTDSGIDLGSGDVGVLNYAYALEQLEAAFYTQVIATPFSGITTSEMELLTDIRNHEVAHREFFKAALGMNAIPGLEVNFTSINFGDRTSVLSTAKAFEDLGVSAYNGAGKLIVSGDYLLLAGKIVSVEARHAAAIRYMMSKSDFGDADTNGFDAQRTPSEVLTIAGTYLKSTINASNLPTS